MSYYFNEPVFDIILYIFILFLPLILGTVTSLVICGVKPTSAENVKIRPEPVVFSIVWPILYVLLGLSWNVARKYKNQILTDFFYLFLNVLLCSWIYVYSCLDKKKESVYVIVGCFTLALVCFSIGNYFSKMTISPLIGWLFLATLLNVLEVEKITTTS